MRREAGSNVIEIKEALLPIVEELNLGVVARNGLEMFLVTDDVRYVQDSIDNVLQNLALGAVLATLVIYLFLRSGGATLVAMVGIPICTLAAFLGLLAAGRTINVISLAGIAFAIGMTVDNTIVVLEAIERFTADDFTARRDTHYLVSAQHVFVFCHHPRWTEGNYGDDWRRVHALLVAAGNVTAVFGGSEVDLRDSSLAPGARLDVFAAFGGVDQIT